MIGLEFGVLGPFEARAGGQLLDLGPRKQRAVLAALLVAAPEVVAADALIDRVWGERPPKSAGHALQVYISNLRRLLEPDRAVRSAGTVLVTRHPGYQAVAGPDQLDAGRFEVGVAAARRLATDDPGGATDRLAALLELWRGPALADFADAAWARDEAARLDGLRLSTVEAMFTAALAAGRHAAVVDELEATARRHPLREGLWRDLIVALYRCGRQADALRAYATVRGHLVDELGIEPGAELRQLEAAVLRHDPSLPWHRPATPVPAGAAPVVAAQSPQVSDDVPPRAVSATPPSPAAGIVGDERRIVTVLFADLVGSTPLGEALDADEYKLVVDGAVERIVASCERYGGRVVNVAGDGVTTLFGAPFSHEDDAERAVLAGLEIVEDVDSYGQEVARSWGVDPLQARVGVNTGPVVTGLTRAGDRADLDAAGDTVNTAARLESAARPGTVIVGAAVRAQLGPDFTFSGARTLDLKGKADPVEAYEATGGRPGGRRPRGLPGRRTALVGRSRELDALAEVARDVNAGRGAALFLSGEAGLGKSRLLGELRRLCTQHAPGDRPPLWLESACISYGDSQPLWPLRRLVDEWIGAAPGLAPMRVRIALRRAVDDVFDSGQADRVYRALATLTGCDDDAATHLRSLEAEARQREIHESIRLLLDRLSSNRPVIVAIDDLHWADDETLDLLDHLLPVIDAAPVLLALVARPEPGHRSWRIRERLVSEFAHRTRSLQLAALAPVDDGDLLSGVVGDALPDDVRSELLGRAGGNPFYLEELVRSLVSGGVLVEADGRLEFHGTVADLGLPETVEQVIVSRLDRLDPAVRRVLTAASAIGQEFETELLAAVTGIGDALDDALVELQRLALVREARRWPAPEFRFEHPLIQEAAYAVLVGSDRRDLHRRIVGALSDRPETEGSHARIAHHLERAGDEAGAASAYLLAAEDADGRGLIRAAHALSGAGRRVAQRLGDAADPGVVARLWLIHLMSGYFVGQLVPNAEEPMAAVELARRAGDPLTEAQGLSVAAIAHILDGDSTRRRQRLVEALGAARRADDLATLSRSLGRLAIDEANALELDQARARVVEAMELTDGAPVESRVPALDGRKLVALYLGELAELGSVLDELFSFAGEPVFERFRANAVAEAAVLDQALGRVDEALAKADRAIALTEELTGPGDRWMALAVKSRILRSRGSYAEALATGLEAFAGACDMGHGYWLPWTAAEYGTALTEVGAFADAVEVLTRGCTAEQASMPSQQLRCAGTLALAGARAGDAEAGRIGRERFEHLSASMRLPAGRAYLYGADGQLAYAETRRLEGDVEQALFVAGAVAAAADASEWLEGAAHAHLVLGSAALAAGDAHAASLEFSASLERAAPYPGLRWRALAGLAASGAPARLEEARAVIAGLGASVAGDPDGHALTAALADPIAAAGLA